MTLAIYHSALNWLDKGFDLLPIQPNTKKHVQGFGIHQARITNARQAVEFFRDTNFNLAVIAPENKFIFDFDDYYIYCDYLKAIPEAQRNTYTELTRNMGTHVFFSGCVPPNFQPIKYVEIKQSVLVAPSVVDKVEYEIFCNKDILTVDKKVFSLLSETPFSELPKSPQVQRPKNNTGSLLDAIKSKYSIVDLMRKHYPKIKLSGRGKFLNACCPFHAEKEPSFWLNTENNLFGCHACNVKGDVINFYARAHGIDNDTAIKQMARAL
ncbi:MAG: bifunctional DNA primase/polymerase [Anaerolineales bacterium]|nr:bifunctional DNA primase/polymerase [Anaerolineales bacterium]